MENQNNIEKLKLFNTLITNYFDGNYEDKRTLESQINRLIPLIQELVKNAGCFKTMTMAPPPAIGGMVIQNFNPFDMIFHNFWGISIIPDIRNMLEQSIGKYENNLVDLTPKKRQQREYQNGYPEKITLKWLLNHVPINIWWAGGLMLLTSFLFGYKLSPLIDELLKIIER